MRGSDDAGNTPSLGGVTGVPDVTSGLGSPRRRAPRPVSSDQYHTRSATEYVGPEVGYLRLHCHDDLQNKAGRTSDVPLLRGNWED